jgi:hypothetical protein
MNASPTTAENGSVAAQKTITRKPGHVLPALGESMLAEIAPHVGKDFIAEL